MDRRRIGKERIAGGSATTAKGLVRSCHGADPLFGGYAAWFGTKPGAPVVPLEARPKDALLQTCLLFRVILDRSITLSPDHRLYLRGIASWVVRLEVLSVDC